MNCVALQAPSSADVSLARRMAQDEHEAAARVRGLATRTGDESWLLLAGNHDVEAARFEMIAQSYEAMIVAARS